MVERVLEKRLHGTVSVDEMQFGFMPERLMLYLSSEGCTKSIVFKKSFICVL